MEDSELAGNEEIIEDIKQFLHHSKAKVWNQIKILLENKENLRKGSFQENEYIIGLTLNGSNIQPEE